MAISYTPTDIRGKAVEPILEEVFFANKTISRGYVTFNDNIKAGTIFTEAGIDVTAQLYTGSALSSSGSIVMTDVYIVPTKLEYKQTFLEESLRVSRFNRDMANGAWNIESNEFLSLVMSLHGKAVSEDAERQYWMGITAAQKAAIAASTPGAGQGSITAAAQTKVAALTAGAVNGVLAKVIYNIDATAIGAYIKVTGTTITSANIAAEYGKTYTAIPAEIMADTSSPVMFYAPYAHRQLIKIANNAVGAAQQVNFLVEGAGDSEKVYYNGVEIAFVPLPADFIYAQRPAALSWNTDLVDDVARVEVGKMQNDGDLKFLRAIYTLNANVGQASKGVLYGG